MLEYIRTSAQSFGVKVAFGIIILVFVFWGVGNFNDRDYTNVVAVVNGEPILAIEFEKAYSNAEEYILRNNPGATREMLAKEHLGRRVLQELIQAVLMSQEARRAGIGVTPLEMRAAVGQMKAFQDENGKFDPESYKRVLEAQRISPAQYEKELENQLLQDKMYDLLTAAVWVDPDEALNRYNFLREKRDIDYIFIPANKYIADVKISEADIKAWYESHLQNFAVPPKVDIAYIAVRPENLVPLESIDEGAAKAWYEANKNKFELKEQVRARHILVPLAENADAAAEKDARATLAKAREALAAGKPFPEVADEFNKPGAAGPGGDLGWFSRGETVPQFEEAVFAMSPGEVSGEIRTPFGLHLILLEEKKEAGARPYEEVRDEARKGVAFDEGSDKLHDVLDNLIEDNILQKPMADSAAKYGLKAETTGLLDKDSLVKMLGIDAAAAESLLAVGAGAPVDTALDAGDKYIVARVAAYEPATTKPLAEVEQEISKTLQTEKAREMAISDATKLLEKIKTEPLQKIGTKYPMLKTGQLVERGAPIEGFGPDTDLVNAIFAAAPGKWLDKAYTEIDKNGLGAMIVHVDKAVAPDAAEFESVRQLMANAVKKERMDALYQMFMQGLLDKSKIEVTNQNLVDRVNM